MRRILLLSILLLVTANQLNAKTSISLKIPVKLGINFYTPGNTWSAFIPGFGFSVDLDVFKSEYVTLSPFIVYTRDHYSIPDNQAPTFASSGGFIASHQLRYGYMIKFFIKPEFFIALGQTFSLTLAGDYGDSTQTNYFTADMLGHELYISGQCGYEIFVLYNKKKEPRLSIPIAVEINYSLTAKPANLWEFGLESGVRFYF